MRRRADAAAALREDVRDCGDDGSSCARQWTAAGGRAAVATIVTLLAVGCARLVTSPAPTDVHTLLVLPVDNRTGSTLAAEPPPLTSLLGGAPPRPTITAADLLTGALRTVLAERGFTATVATPARPIASAAEAAQFVAASDPDAVALYTQLQTWEGTSMSHLVYVDVGLEASLVAPDGRLLWTARLPATPIDGGTASSVSLGYPEVARRVAELVVGDLRPAATPP